MIYLSIAVKLLIGMVGIILFLRISGKTQMAQLTPLDSVNAFVLGALVGGVIYTPGTPVWYLLFAFAVWTGVNVCLRYLMRLRRVRRAIMGDPVMLVRNRELMLKEFRRNGLEMEQFRTMLRENGIFSMFDVDDVRFETNGQITISRRNEPPESYLLVNGGKVMEDALKRSGKSERWLMRHLRQEGCNDIEKLFCVEWSPGRGLYVVPMEQPRHPRKRASSNKGATEKTRKEAGKPKEKQPPVKTRQTADKPKAPQPTEKIRKEGKPKEEEQAKG